MKTQLEDSYVENSFGRIEVKNWSSGGVLSLAATFDTWSNVLSLVSYLAILQTLNCPPNWYNLVTMFGQR